MERLQTKVIVVLAAASCVLFLLVPPVSGCSCQMAHPQDLACRADFIIRATVTETNQTSSFPLRGGYQKWMRAYAISPRMRIFKASEEARLALKLGYLLTPMHSSACGVESFEDGEMYVIAGHISNGMPTISLCDWTAPWATVTPRQKKGIAGLYLSACSCKITFCTGNCPWIRSKKECPWNINEDCETNHSACLADRKGRCHWVTGRLYNACKARYKEKDPSVVLALDP